MTKIGFYARNLRKLKKEEIRIGQGSPVKMVGMGKRQRRRKGLF
jgi:hypothetical protein